MFMRRLALGGEWVGLCHVLVGEQISALSIGGLLESLVAGLTLWNTVAWIPLGLDHCVLLRPSHVEDLNFYTSVGTKIGVKVKPLRCRNLVVLCALASSQLLSHILQDLLGCL